MSLTTHCRLEPACGRGTGKLGGARAGASAADVSGDTCAGRDAGACVGGSLVWMVFQSYDESAGQTKGVASA